MFLHVTDVSVMSDFRLYVTFNNGETGIINLSHRLTGTMFLPLKNPEMFATAFVHPELETVAWANGADLAPEYLFELMKQQAIKAA